MARKQKEEALIAKRRDLVKRYRIDEHLSLSQIQERLKKDKINVDTSTISRDLIVMRQEIREDLSRSGFNAAEVVALALRKYNNRESYLMKLVGLQMVRKDPDAAVVAVLTRAANDCTRSMMELMQDVGLIDRYLGKVILTNPDDAEKNIERIPSGEEIQRLFQGVVVEETELISEAEKAWMYGDDTSGASGAPEQPGDQDATGQTEG